MTVTFDNNLREIKKILYRLKRQFGLTGYIWRPIVNNNDRRTGRTEREYSIIKIRRAIFLPRKIDRSFIYDLAYIAAAKNFTEGGYFDRNRRTVIIDASDLPNGFDFTDDDYIVFKDKSYLVASHELSEDFNGFLLSIQDLTQSDKFGVSLTVTGTLTPDATAGYVINGKFPAAANTLSYQTLNGSYWIWFDGSDWIISTARGDISGPHWLSATQTGAFAPLNGAVGTATVS